MSQAPALLYLEADDEITAVVRRVRAADASRVVVVAPGRSRATSSAVALRLLARAADDAGRELSVVGDALTRSLAAEAGLPAHATVDEARRADPDAPVAEPEPHHATIQVVRGTATDETAPTMAAIPAASAEAPGAAAAAETVVAPVVRPLVRRPAPLPRRRRVRHPPIALLATGAMILVLVGIAAGAALLPAATITVAPRSAPIGPIEDEVVISDPSRATGTVEASATVTATGTYSVQEPATGTVVLFNWNFRPVGVPAETLVAAGEQAFATVAEVVVPAGSLTREGRIQAGEMPVGVVASAIGPAGNVDVGAIDTVLSRSVEAQLSGFPGSGRLVTNPEPTSGGQDTTGSEVTQEDVDAAVVALRDELASAAAEAIRAEDGLIVVLPDAAAEPTIDVPEGLVGTRDQAEAEISGSLDWQAFSVAGDEVDARARDAFAQEAALPPDRQLLPDATQVTLGEPRLEEETIVVPVTVRGRSLPAVDESEVLERTRGLSAEAAEAALAGIGEVSVELWPGWVDSVPQLEWRVDVRIDELDAAPQPSASP